jgi:membrane complex biogenesis BtpA family protein
MNASNSANQSLVGKDTKSLFGNRPQLWGMLHVGALPVTPKSSKSPDQLVQDCLEEASLLAESGLDGLILENMHDLPYVQPPASPEVIANMTRLADAVRKEHPDLPLGIQILASANREALAVAHACNLDFIRAEGFVFGHVADEGWTDANAGALMRYRKSLGAQHIRVFTDIKKKHSAHAVTSDVNLVETAEAAEFFLSDGLIITGSSTGKAASPEELDAVSEAVSIPVIIGSGVNPSNLSAFSKASALIAGSYLKKGGQWDQPLDRDRVLRLVEAVRG